MMNRSPVLSLAFALQYGEDLEPKGAVLLCKSVSYVLWTEPKDEEGEEQLVEPDEEAESFFADSGQ